MQKFITICVAILVLLACTNKKKSLSGEDPVDINDFIEFFQELPLPYNIADTQINKKLPDSLLISNKILTQFIPDSVFTKDYGKGSKPKFYALGKIQDKDNEIYLLVKAATLAKQAAYILCFDKDKNFSAAMMLVRNNPDRKKIKTGSIDKRFIITTSQSHQGSDGQNYYELNAFVYNSAGVFNLIKIESNQPLEPKEVYNPIDTFAKKNKLSGDYVQNKKNFVSIRDGKDAKHILFFAHFERKDDCSGELKGEAVLVKSAVAQYRQVGGDCVLQLVFNGNKVSLSEERGCGNYRGIKCVFEGSYLKKKEAVKSKRKPAVK